MTVHVEHVAPVLLVTIDRPDALNAIDFDVMEALEQAVEVLETDRDLRAMVLTGAGDRAFVSGGDLRKFATLETRAQAAEMSLRMKAILDRFEAVDAWVVAAVNGVAYGGGSETALACDFRIAAETATFGFTQARFAVPPGWGGLTRLIEVVGKPKALEWLATTATVDAHQALHAGLVHTVVPSADLHGEALRFAERVSRNDRALIGALKTGARRASELPRGEAIEAELEPFVTCWTSDLHHERIEEFLAGRETSS